jgi:hypothetical protein
LTQDDAAKHAWVKRALGLDVGSGGQSPSLPAAITGWRRALETIDGQIPALQQRLRAAPDPELQQIAEFGLGAMTGSHKVKIQAALLEVQAGAGRKAGAAARLVGAFLAHLASDPRIAACDASPFGVPMSIRKTLSPALTTLQAALQTAVRS